MKTQQNNSNKTIKKWKTLTGVFAALSAIGITTSITLPLVLNKEDTHIPTPQPSEDVIVSGSYKYTTPTGEDGEPVKPDDYVTCDLEEISFCDMTNWYANASTDKTVVGNMIAYDMVCIGWLAGEYSHKYSASVTYNFTQQRITGTIETEATDEESGGVSTFKLELVNVPYWLSLIFINDAFVPIWTPIGQMEAGFMELWSFDNWSLKIQVSTATVEINQDLYDENFNDVSMYAMGPCRYAFEDVKIKPF